MILLKNVFLINYLFFLFINDHAFVIFLIRFTKVLPSMHAFQINEYVIDVLN